ncbi:MAG TPA: oligosaccharide flippase family protein [Chitinophagales bacterium]|nr:oligosaccharide flippase family protein [Chitinophagales bacterium]HNM09659.1 oligosaccharide flippase family protein [Chitinophagales bacterium]
MRSPNSTQAIQIFQVARFGALLLASICLSKSGMSVHDIGQYETCILLAGTLSFFWINGTTHTYLSQARRGRSSSLNSSLFWSVVCTSILLIGGMLLFQKPLLQLFKLEIDTRFFWLLIIFFVVNNLAFIVDYYLLAADNAQGLLRLSAFHLIVQTSLIAIPAFIYHDFQSAFTGAIVFVSIKAAITIFLTSRNGGLALDLAVVRKFLSDASPLILSFFLGGMAIYVDGIIVTQFYDKGTFATYQYGAREFPITLLLANAFSAAMVAHISNAPSDTEKVLQGTSQLMRRIFPIVIILMALSYWLYPLVYNPQFKNSYIYFNIYLLLTISRLCFPNAILLGHGNSKIILRAGMIEFLLNIIVSITLLKLIGIQGVAYGTVIALMANKSILIYHLHKQGVPLRTYFPVRLASIYGSVLVAVFIFFTYFIHL